MTSFCGHDIKNNLKMATLECFENLIWLKITIRTNKLEYLLYN